LQGKAQAFEGIRLIKERKATIENAWLSHQKSECYERHPP
jgi:hypothetical protein